MTINIPIGYWRYLAQQQGLNFPAGLGRGNVEVLKDDSRGGGIQNFYNFWDNTRILSLQTLFSKHYLS